MTDLSISEIAGRLAGHAEALCKELLPNGHRDGVEWRCGSIDGEPGDSLGIHLVGEKTGAWSDFAGPPGNGGDLIDLIEKTRRLTKGEAVKWAKARLGLGDEFGLPDKPSHVDICPSVARAYRADDAKPVLPIPRSAGKAPLHPKHGKPTLRFAYHDDAGEVLFIACRFDPYGPKALPLSFWTTPDGKGEWKWKALPTPRPLFGLRELAKRPDSPVLLAEGEKSAKAAQKLFPDYIAMTWPGGTSGVASADWTSLKGRDVTIWPDNDEPGRKAAQAVAECCHKVGADAVKLVSIPEDEFPWKWDLADPLPAGWDQARLATMLDMVVEIETIAAAAPSISKSTQRDRLLALLAPRDWGDLTSLPSLLPLVPSLPESMIPTPLRGWIVDFAERAQMPLDFIAAPAIVALSSLVGRNIGIHPKQRDNWLVVPNLWGAVTGRPGVMKSAAIAEALRPLGRLVATAIEEHEGAAAESKMVRQNLEDEITVERAAFKANLKAGKTQEAEGHKKRLAVLQGQLDDANPKERRYIANDATTEKLGEILKDNSRGLLLSRDELSGWLRTLDKSGREGDREFFLESWNGDGAFTCDRIGRGTIHIPALCLGIVGGIQPGKLLAYQSAAMQGGIGDDGLLQRFQMLVWPAVSSKWNNIDRAPHKEGRERADWVYQQIDQLKPEGVGAEAGYGDIPALHFDGEAQELFNEWRGMLEHRLRGGSEEQAPAFESHLSKYRSLLPSLALIFHLIEVVAGGQSGPVTLDATRLAAAWCDYLEAHARKVYAAELNHDLAAAHAIEAKIKGGAVEDGGSVRDIYRHHWAGLSTPDELWSGLRVLEKYNIIRVEEQQGEGRSADIIRIHPRTAA